jgi:hypothetical protein
MEQPTVQSTVQPTISTPDQTKLKLKKTIKKIVALSLIISPLVHIYLSAKDVLFILPQISFVGDPQTINQLYTELLKKAITISVNLFLNTIYGFTLLVKPLPATKTIHIVLGIILFIVSNFVFRLAAIDQLLQQLEFLPLT